MVIMLLNINFTSMVILKHKDESKTAAGLLGINFIAMSKTQVGGLMEVKIWGDCFQPVGIISGKVCFPSSILPSPWVENPCSTENGVALPSLLPQLTSGSYSAFHDLSNAILLVSQSQALFRFPVPAHQTHHQELSDRAGVSLCLSVSSATPRPSRGPHSPLLLSAHSLYGSLQPGPHQRSLPMWSLDQPPSS